MSVSLISVHVREDMPPVAPELVFRVASPARSFWETHCVQVVSLDVASQLLAVLDTYDRAQDLCVEREIERWDGSAWVDLTDDCYDQIEAVTDGVDAALASAHRRVGRAPSRWSVPCPLGVADEELDARIAARFAAGERSFASLASAVRTVPAAAEVVSS